MPQLRLVGPAAELDLGDELRLDAYRPLAWGPRAASSSGSRLAASLGIARSAAATRSSWEDTPFSAASWMARASATERWFGCGSKSTAWRCAHASCQCNLERGLQMECQYRLDDLVGRNSHGVALFRTDSVRVDTDSTPPARNSSPWPRYSVDRPAEGVTPCFRLFPAGRG